MITLLRFAIDDADDAAMLSPRLRAIDAFSLRSRHMLSPRRLILIIFGHTHAH